MITYKYRLYSTKKTRSIDAMLRECAYVWNHALALQRRYYKMFKKFIPYIRMAKHFSKTYERNLIHSQTLQEILERQIMLFRDSLNTSQKDLLSSGKVRISLPLYSRVKVDIPSQGIFSKSTD